VYPIQVVELFFQIGFGCIGRGVDYSQFDLSLDDWATIDLTAKAVDPLAF
jgi:hypothetical protein